MNDDPFWSVDQRVKVIFDLVAYGCIGFSQTHLFVISVIACGVLVLGYGQVAFWALAAERQTYRIRLRFFKNIMRQEIGWFDTHEIGELNTRMTE